MATTSTQSLSCVLQSFFLYQLPALLASSTKLPVLSICCKCLLKLPASPTACHNCTNPPSYPPNSTHLQCHPLCQEVMRALAIRTVPRCRITKRTTRTILLLLRRPAQMPTRRNLRQGTNWRDTATSQLKPRQFLQVVEEASAALLAEERYREAPYAVVTLRVAGTPADEALPLWRGEQRVVRGVRLLLTLPVWYLYRAPSTA